MIGTNELLLVPSKVKRMPAHNAATQSTPYVKEAENPPSKRESEATEIDIKKAGDSIHTGRNFGSSAARLIEQIKLGEAEE